MIKQNTHKNTHKNTDNSCDERGEIANRNFNKNILLVKTFLLLLALVTSIVSMMAWGELSRWRELSETYANKKGVMLAKTIEPRILDLVNKNDTDALQQIAMTLTSGGIPNNDVLSVQILDAKLQKLADASPQIISGEENFVHLPPTIVVATPLMNGFIGKSVGELRIIFSNRLFELQSREVINSSIITLLVGVILSGFLAFLIVKRINFPFSKLTDAARRVATGEFGVRVNSAEIDEVGVLVDTFNHMTESIDVHLGEMSDKNTQLQERIDELVNLKHIGHSLNSVTDIDEIYEAIVDHSINILGGVKRCSLLIVDDKKEEFIFHVTKGLGPDAIPESRRLPITSGIAAKVFRSGEPILLNDLENDDDSKKLEEAKVIRSSICAPLIEGDDVFAILSVSNRIVGKPFTEQDLKTISGIAFEASTAIRNAKIYRQLNKKILELHTLHEVGKTLGTVLEISKLLELILDLTTKLLGGVKTCSIMLYDKETETLQLMLYKGEKEMQTFDPIKVGEGISGKVFEKNEPMIISDMNATSSDSSENSSVRSSICVPLRAKQISLGVLSVSDKLSGEAFDNSDLDMVVTLASQISISLYNAQLYEDLESSYLSAVRALANSLDEKDNYTRGHSERVARYSVEIGHVMNFSPAEIKNLHIGALLHDIGKIGISEMIITKKSRLTNDEFDAIKTHPARGASIVQHAKFLKDKIPLIKYHHERYDGKGYPDGLKGEDIPILARIVCVADSYDAMTSRRAYKTAMSREDARTELVRCSGTQFDPKVVASFVEVMTDERKLDFIEKLGK